MDGGWISCLTRWRLGSPSGPPILTFPLEQGPLSHQWWLLLGPSPPPTCCPTPHPDPRLPCSCTPALGTPSLPPHPPSRSVQASPLQTNKDTAGPHTRPLQLPRVGLHVSTPGPRFPLPPSPSPTPAACCQASALRPPPQALAPHALPTWPKATCSPNPQALLSAPSIYLGAV